MAEIAAILLAAGQATRFAGGPEATKLIAEFKGKPLIRHAVEAALASRAAPVGVVTGHAAEKILRLLDGLNLFTVHNGAYAKGLSGSLKAGVAALPPGAKGAVILLGDMPLVTGAVIDALIACFEAAPDEPAAVVPVRDGRRGNPVLLGRELFPDLLALKGDEGARRILQGLGDRLALIEAPDDGVLFDVDQRGDLDNLPT